MGKRYSTRTCVQCGCKDIQPRMYQVEIEYTSGSSNTGMNGRTIFFAALGGEKSQKQVGKWVAHPNKRVYKRRRKVWMCPDCYNEKRRKEEEEAKAAVQGFFILIGIIAAVTLWVVLA